MIPTDLAALQALAASCLRCGGTQRVEGHGDYGWEEGPCPECRDVVDACDEAAERAASEADREIDERADEAREAAA